MSDAKISIMCPNCKKFLIKADKDDKKMHKLACKNCNKWIWFVPSNGYFEVKDVPKRTQASGKRFY